MPVAQAQRVVLLQQVAHQVDNLPLEIQLGELLPLDAPVEFLLHATNILMRAIRQHQVVLGRQAYPVIVALPLETRPEEFSL